MIVSHTKIQELFNFQNVKKNSRNYRSKGPARGLIKSGWSIVFLFVLLELFFIAIDRLFSYGHNMVTGSFRIMLSKFLS